jgi:flagellar biogenesis protein FliO
VLCDTRSLGNKQFLVVASYEQEKFLLGISSGSIQLLSKLNSVSEKEDSNPVISNS